MLKWTTMAACAAAALTPTLQAHFLWMVDTDKPSYLYGTIHSSDPAVRHLPAEVIDALERSDSFHPEVELSPENIGRITAAMFAPGASNLEEELPADLWRRLADNANRIGLPPNLLRRIPVQMTPLLFASPPGTDFNQVIDVQVYELAKQYQLDIQALETVDEQLGVFRNLSREQAAALLKEALNELEEGFPAQQEMIEVYAAENLDGLTAIFNREFGRLEMPDLEEALIGQRNAAMTHRLLPHLKAGGAFAAIGVGHMPGESGMIALLMERGYQVTRVPLTKEEE